MQQFYKRRVVLITPYHNLILGMKLNIKSALLY